MVKTKKFATRQNITKKKHNKEKNNTYYASHFAGTELLPRTSIMNYLFTNYGEFSKLKRESIVTNKELISMEDCFNVGGVFDVINTKGDAILLNATIERNKNFSIDKLISYAFYSKSKDIFERSDLKESVGLLKYQMGKDIHRDDRIINGEDYGKSFFAKYSENYYNCTDKFYEIIIGDLHKISRFIDYNLINKIALLSCQSMYNFIIDLISHEIMSKILPEAVNITQAEKSQEIILTSSKQEMIFKFKSKAYITYQGEIMDITNPCANLEFELLFDFKNNNFKFTQFIFEYDYSICKKPELDAFNSEPTIAIDSGNSDDKKSNNENLLYGVSAGLGAAGIASIPFILGALGGKKRKDKKKQTSFKKKRNRKTKISRNK